jgi:hypothetical protein
MDICSIFIDSSFLGGTPKDLPAWLEEMARTPAQKSQKVPKESSKNWAICLPEVPGMQ